MRRTSKARPAFFARSRRRVFECSSTHRRSGRIRRAPRTAGSRRAGRPTGSRQASTRATRRRLSAGSIDSSGNMPIYGWCAYVQGSSLSARLPPGSGACSQGRSWSTRSCARLCSGRPNIPDLRFQVVTAMTSPRLTASRSSRRYVVRSTSPRTRCSTLRSWLGSLGRVRCRSHQRRHVRSHASAGSSTSSRRRRAGSTSRVACPFSTHHARANRARLVAEARRGRGAARAAQRAQGGRRARDASADGSAEAALKRS